MPQPRLALYLLTLLGAVSASSSSPLGAQDLLLGGKKSSAPRSHVTWSVKVEPAEIAAGSRGEIVASYETAPGWHLYAPDHTGTGIPTAIAVEPAAVQLVPPLKFPPPKVKEEPLLNETHRLLEGKGEIRAPFVVPETAAPGELAFKARLKFMTCDEKGCDPPGSFEAPLVVKVLPAVEEHVKWKVSVTPTELRRGGRGEVIVAYETEKGWHIYAPDHPNEAKTTITIEATQLTLDATAQFPKPIEKKVEGLDELERILEGKGEIRQGFTVARDAAVGPLAATVKVSFQVCDANLCLPGESVTGVELKVSDAPPLAGAAPAAAGAAPQVPQALGQGLLGFILAMVGGALFALAMPCTYPMIPLTIAFFTKQADARQGAVLPLALAYGAGIVLIFNAIGLLFATAIGRFSAHPVVNLLFGLIFVIFALSFFSLFEIRLPTTLNLLSSKAAGAGGYLGVFLLGSTLVITSFTCTAPILGALLSFAGQGGDRGRVMLGMTVFGLTMAAPFVLLSLYPSRVRSLPRSGEWMHTLKVTLGFLELAFALKFFSNADLTWDLKVLPRELFLVLWSAMLLVTGLYLLGTFRMKNESAEGIGGIRLCAGIAAIGFCFYFFHGALGSRLDWITEGLIPNYSAPRVAGAGGGEGDRKAEAAWTIVEDDYEGGLARARAEGKLAFINFTGVT
jgi:thiol:disulfide interchange protein DsbD